MVDISIVNGVNSMVYGRYKELVHGGCFMAYKPTNITGGAIPYRMV
jgi:hypothetical protein